MLGRSYLYGHWLATEAADEAADCGDIDRAAAAATIVDALERGQSALEVSDVVARPPGVRGRARPTPRAVRQAAPSRWPT